MAKISDERRRLLKWAIQLTELEMMFHEDDTDEELRAKIYSELTDLENYQTAAYLACDEELYWNNPAHVPILKRCVEQTARLTYQEARHECQSIRAAAAEESRLEASGSLVESTTV